VGGFEGGDILRSNKDFLKSSDNLVVSIIVEEEETKWSASSRYMGQSMQVSILTSD